MPKYMIVANYTAEGTKGLLAKGGSARREAVAESLAKVGGSLESFYFGFGEDDAFVIVDMPDNVSAAALGLQVAASGMASARTVVLLTPEEVDQAAQVPSTYRAPGS